MNVRRHTANTRSSHAHTLVSKFVFASNEGTVQGKSLPDEGHVWKLPILERQSDLPFAPHSLKICVWLKTASMVHCGTKRISWLEPPPPLLLFQHALFGGASPPLSTLSSLALHIKPTLWGALLIFWVLLCISLLGAPASFVLCPLLCYLPIFVAVRA